MARLGDTLQQVWDEGTAADVLLLLCCAPHCTSPSLSCTVQRPQPCSTPSCCHSTPSLPEPRCAFTCQTSSGSTEQSQGEQTVWLSSAWLLPSPPLPYSRWLGMVTCWNFTRNFLVGSPGLSASWPHATGRLQGGEQQGGQAGSSVSCALVTSQPCKAQSLAVPGEASCVLSCGLLQKGSSSWKELGPKGCLSSGKDWPAPSPVPTHPMCLFFSRLLPHPLQASLSARPQACLQLPSHGISSFQTPWPHCRVKPIGPAL